MLSIVETESFVTLAVTAAAAIGYAGTFAAVTVAAALAPAIAAGYFSAFTAATYFFIHFAHLLCVHISIFADSMSTHIRQPSVVT